MKVLMSFYEDREEEGELRRCRIKEEEAENVFLSQSIRFRTPFCIFHSSFILPGLTYFIQRRRDRDVIS
jgi:hypothetical protein